MKNKIVLFMGLILLFSCAENLIEKPKNLIPEDKMVLVLKEIAILNAAKGTNAGNLKDNGIDPTNYVFNKFEIDSAQFVDSDRYYASLPLVYESFYEKIETQLTDAKLALETQKKLKDSLELVKRSLKKKPSLKKKSKK